MTKWIVAFKKQCNLYLMEAWGLGMFMIAASLITILFQHPDLKLVYRIPSDIIRRLLIGIVMGTTAVGIIYSPWGRKSGAHINPSVTLTMLFLHKISLMDAFFYIVFQTIGGIIGIGIIVMLLPSYMNYPAVDYIVTIPGKSGIPAAIIGEAIISFLMMFITLISSNNKKIQHLTGFITGLLIISFVTFEAPYSGFSMNPSRTIASAISSHNWTSWPLYIVVPPLSMLFAAILYKIVFHQGTYKTLKHYFAPKGIS
jgi:aquaporin Z